MCGYCFHPWHSAWQVGGQLGSGKITSRLYLKYRNLILGSDIGWRGCRCATLTFDLNSVSLTLKTCLNYIMETVLFRKLILPSFINWGVQCYGLTFSSRYDIKNYFKIKKKKIKYKYNFKIILSFF